MKNFFLENKPYFQLLHHAKVKERNTNILDYNQEMNEVQQDIELNVDRDASCSLFRS
jgi:hypothetical protein